MPDFTTEGMEEVGKINEERLRELRQLIATPFNPTNKKQIRLLDDYLNRFELSANSMQLYRNLENLFIWGIVYSFAQVIIPILPDLKYTILIGWVCSKLKNHRLKESEMELQEMKIIYNWCLKNGDNVYNSKINNDQNLANPSIQRLIKLLAPICRVEFMMAWPPGTGISADNKTQKSIDNNGESLVKSGWNTVVNVGSAVCDVGGKAYSFLTNTAPTPPKNTENKNTTNLPLNSSPRKKNELLSVDELKYRVETQQFKYEPWGYFISSSTDYARERFGIIFEIIAKLNHVAEQIRPNNGRVNFN